MAILSLSLRGGVAGLVSLSLAACVAPSNPPPQTASRGTRIPIPDERPSYPVRVTPPAAPVTPAAYPPQSYPQPTYPEPYPAPSPPPYSAPPVAANGGMGRVGYDRPAASLDPQINELWRNFPGKTGVAIRRIDGNWSVSRRGNELFPQQSVSKIWVAMTIFDKIDKGLITLNDEVVIGMDDLTLFHQPIRARVLKYGTIKESVASLLEQSIVTSDCTANDSLLRYAGGPQAVRAFFEEKGISGVRFSEGERHMQSTIAGLRWRQSYSLANNFEVARAEIPGETRQRLLNNYVADPIDGAAPEAIAQALARLARGELLSPGSTQRILAIMARTKSGPNRLKAGVPMGWGFLHKTGTGQVYGAMQTGYNDIGIMTAPDGARYAVVVMMGSTTASIPDRMVMMQGVSRAVANGHVR